MPDVVNPNPYIRAQYQVTDGYPWGNVSQASEFSADNVAYLLGSPDVSIDGLAIIPDLAAIILEPVLRPVTFGTAETTQTGSTKWRAPLDPATKKAHLVQHDASASVSWSAASTANLIEDDNAPFSVNLYLGAPPQSTPDDERNADGIYRRILWPSDAAAGENLWSVTIPYNQTPYLERSTDGGTLWVNEGPINAGSSLSQLWQSRNARTALTVLVVDKSMALWLGDPFGYGAKVIVQSASYKAGPVKIEGKGGFTSIGFSKVRFKTTGSVVSYKHFGPRDMVTPSPSVYFYGTPAATLTSLSQTMTGSIVETDAVNYMFRYKLEMTSPAAAAPDDAYSATTPWCKQINTVWPIVSTAPTPDGWTDLYPHAYKEKIWFDPASRVLRRWCQITARVYDAELHPMPGVENLRVYMGDGNTNYLGAYGILRGYFVYNTETTVSASDGQGFVTADGNDLIWFLEPRFTRRRFYPSRWCVYSVVRLLLEAGGIVPEFQDTLYSYIRSSNAAAGGPSQVCAFGQDPDGCRHTKVPAHPGWPELFPILAGLDEMRDLEFAWYGTDANSQFRFEPFDATSYTAIQRNFTPFPSTLTALDAIGQPNRGAVLTRTKSVSGVKNEITAIGVDETTGAFILKQRRDENSIGVRGSFNYTGGVRPYVHASSLFQTEAYAQAAVDSAYNWIRLSYEGLQLPTNGQPDLFPTVESGQLITVFERSTWGPNPVSIFVTDVTHEIPLHEPGKLLCWIGGVWNGWGAPPGT